MAESISVRTGDDWEPVGQFAVRTGGVWRDILQGYVRVSGVWETFYRSLTVAISPTSRTASRFGPGLVTTDPFTAVAGGGIGPFTYAWVIDSQSGPVTATLTTSSGLSTAVTATLGTADTVTGTVRVTVTDTATGETFQSEQAFFILQAFA